MKKRMIVVFYSRTKVTSKLGKNIAKDLNCEFEEIIDLKNRLGVIGWIGSRKDALFRKSARIKNIERDFLEYDLVIIGTPIWAENLTPAVREFLKKFNDKFKKISFFCTCKTEAGKIFNEMSWLSKDPISTLEVRIKNVKQNNYGKIYEEYINKLKNK